MLRVVRILVEADMLQMVTRGHPCSDLGQGHADLELLAPAMRKGSGNCGKVKARTGFAVYAGQPCCAIVRSSCAAQAILSGTDMHHPACMSI